MKGSITNSYVEAFWSELPSTFQLTPLIRRSDTVQTSSYEDLVSELRGDSSDIDLGQSQLTQHLSRCVHSAWNGERALDLSALSAIWRYLKQINFTSNYHDCMKIASSLCSSFQQLGTLLSPCVRSLVAQNWDKLNFGNQVHLRYSHTYS